MKIEDLSIEEKIGQMIIIGMDTPNVIDKIDTLILKYKIGGVLLYKKNYKDYKELVELINYIKKINTANKIPLFIAIDQEGGRVNRMPQDIANLPSAYKTATYDEELISQAADITGEMLSKTGFNMNFAPVLDIKRFGDNHAIGDRAFSEDISKVEEMGIKYMHKLQEQKIISVIKHFPGHGATKKDSHFIVPIINKKIEELEEQDMIPFEQAIKNGADSILLGHLLIRKVAKNVPVSMSRKFITKYLRKKYHYKGLIITDDMRMKGVQILYGKNRAVKRAFRAGNDIVLFKYGNDEKVIKQIIDEVKKDSIKQARVNRSVERILKIKEKYEINDAEVKINQGFIEELNTKIEEINNKVKGKG